MAEVLWRLRGGRTRLLTAVGDDADGQYLNNIAPGLISKDCTIKGARTPSYAALLDSRGECLLGLGDMALHNYITPDLVNKHIKLLEKSPLIVLDGNVPQATIDYVLTVCQQLEKPVFYEPTDRRKATKVLQNKHIICFATPNLLELRAMVEFLKPETVQNYTNTSMNSLDEIIHLSEELSRFIKILIVTIGSGGVVTIKNDVKQGHEKLEVKHYPIEPLQHIENVSGAGDCFSSGLIHGILSGFKESQCISMGFKAAKLTLLSKSTVSYNLNSINSSPFDEAYFVTVK